MIISGRGININSDKLLVKMNNVSLEYASTFKYFGVVIV